MNKNKLMEALLIAALSVFTTSCNTDVTYTNEENHYNVTNNHNVVNVTNTVMVCDVGSPSVKTL